MTAGRSNSLVVFQSNYGISQSYLRLHITVIGFEIATSALSEPFLIGRSALSSDAWHPPPLRCALQAITVARCVFKSHKALWFRFSVLVILLVHHGHSPFGLILLSDATEPFIAKRLLINCWAGQMQNLLPRVLYFILESITRSAPATAVREGSVLISSSRRENVNTLVFHCSLNP